MLFNLIMLAVPVVFLCASAILAVKAFEHGKSRKKTVLILYVGPKLNLAPDLTPVF